MIIIKLKEFINQRDKSKVKDNSLKNFKTGDKQKKLDRFLQLNFNENTKVSIKEQLKMRKLDKFKQ